MRNFDYPFWRATVAVALQIASGCGLLVRRRWAWILGVTAAVVFVAEGLRRLLFVHFEYEWAIALVYYCAPAIFILVCLLSCSVWRAFLGEGAGGCQLNRPTKLGTSTALFETLDPKARDDLRRVLIHDQASRDAIASQLLRYRDGHGDDCADIIDMLTMNPDARRRVTSILGEIEARMTREEG
jgi:hypothetical protein